MRLGSLSIESGNGGMKLTDEDIANLPGIVPDVEAQNVGGVYDFIAYGLPEAGQTHKLVTPLLNPIPAGAVYRKYFPDTGWGSFIVTDRDKVRSSPGEPGYCFPPGGDIWVEGLVEGYWCVQVEIVDGGPNDADGLVNGTVVDPGGVSVLLADSNNSQPQALDDTQTTKLNTPVTIDALANDTDPDNDPLVITSANPNFGSAEIVNNQVLFTPTENYIGEVQIGYGISDEQGGSSRAVVFVTVEVSNAPPVATDDSANAIGGEPLGIVVTGNDSDPDNDDFTIVSVEANDGIAVIIDGGNGISFTPDIDFTGTTIIIYQIEDVNGGVDEGIVNVTVASGAVVTRIDTSGGGGGSIYWLLLGVFIVLYNRIKIKIMNFNAHKSNWSQE